GHHRGPGPEHGGGQPGRDRRDPGLDGRVLGPGAQGGRLAGPAPDPGRAPDRRGRRTPDAWAGGRLIRRGLLIVVAGIGCETAALFPALPVAVAVAGWAVGGFGIGLAYSPISLIVLGEAPSGQEGAASGPLQPCENPQ